MSWYVVLFGAAITATLPRLRATRFADEMLAGNQFVTSVALLKALLQAKQSKTPAVRPVELARQIRMSIDETDFLLEALEKLGYVRRLAVTRAGRRSEHDWMLICDENAMTLKPLFEHFAVDPANSLINTDALGLRAMRTRWFQSDWLKAPLAAGARGSEVNSDHEQSYRRILPAQIFAYITQSPIKLYSGCLNDAGLFFSNTKWPIHAKP